MASWCFCTPGASGSSSAAKVVESEEIDEKTQQTVTFNVGGQHFEVLRRTLQTDFAEPTLLEELALGGHKSPIFVDASPERFPYILDWYRYEEIHLPNTVPLQAFLKDCAALRLPDFVKVNGTMCPLPSIGTQPDARTLCDEAWFSIKDDWPQFQKFLDSVIERVQQQLGDRARLAGVVKHDVGVEEAPFTSNLPLSTPTGFGSCEHIWKDEENVCSKERLNVLVSAVQERGFTCEVSPVHRRRDGTVKPLELKVGLGRRVGSKGHPVPSDAASTVAACTVTPFSSTASWR